MEQYEHNQPGKQHLMPSPKIAWSAGGDQPKRAASALIWAAVKGLENITAYLSKASDDTADSSCTISRDFMRVFLLLKLP
jgi:hypothetical protein